MTATCAILTTATNLAVNAWLRLVAGSYDAYLLGGELGATVLEAAAYVDLSRRHAVGPALIASGLANGTSFAAGVVLF
jgi:hypothetical protein